ncbi:hypothetical protein LMG28688_03252 [Paraburkholderia caffeinitolerans]|uniref:Uncharacterized protein n=2 Tax=Paraburkholderia caffeinitolerans TaxID=1723730 RepID=A0A6J5G1U3_9BURK|nr:hypothetical protein LMG28688_03252 [Paraburkholderia caffeinitolerans]
MAPLLAASCWLPLHARFWYAAPFPLAAIESMELPFNEAGVSVTRTALSSAGQVFPLRDIDDMRIVFGQRKRTVPIALALIGVALAAVGGAYGSGAGLGCGVMLVVVGWLAWIWQDAKHQLIVVTGGESREAVWSADIVFLERVEQAVRAAKATSATNGSPARPTAQ